MPTITPAVISGTGSLSGKYNVRIIAEPMAGVGGAPIYAYVQILLGPSGAAAVEVSPGLEVEAYGGNAGEVSFFTPTVSGSGTAQLVGNAAVSIGDLEVAGFAGGNATVDVSGLAIEAQATVQRVGHCLVTLDGVQVQATGTQHNRSISGEISFPAAKIEGTGYQDGSGQADILISRLEVLGVAAVGPVGDCLVEIEFEGLPIIEASGWISALAQGEITLLPAMVIAAQGGWPNRFKDLILRYEDEYQP